MTRETLAAFAARMGWHRSSAGRARDAGRLVMVDGKVDVDASLARLAETESRHDVTARHTEARQQPAAPASQQAAQGDEAEEEGVTPSYQEAKARKEHWNARLAELQFKRENGDLIPKEDVDFVLQDFGATLRTLLEGLADRLAPVVYPLQNLEDTHRAISEAAEEIGGEIAEQLRRRDRGQT